MRLLGLRWFPALLGCAVGQAGAAESVPTVASAIERGLAQVTRAGDNWRQHKTCFSCHHQTLPMLAMVEAARVGFPLDQSRLKAQGENAHRYFAARIEDMDDGEHVPGGAGTAGYGLWALSLDHRPADKTTTAIVTYLLQIQGVPRLKSSKAPDSAQPREGRWIASCQRAPLQGSTIGDTVLVLIGLKRYATPEQHAKVSVARAAAEKYLAQTKARNHQDLLWRLWGLHHLEGDAGEQTATRAAVLRVQHADGGWAQTASEPASDAFSTGQTLFMLCQTGTAPDDPVAQRARDFLLRTQLADGSWLVESRVKVKAQPYFENGDPHGEHQFISTAATAWATAALAQLLPAR